MKTWLAAIAAALALLVPIEADAIPGADPTQYIPMAGTGQYGVAITSLQTLTIPAGALIAEICVETAAARYTTTGTTPSSSVGIPVVPQSSTIPACFQLSGVGALNAFKIIGSGATMDVEYFKASGSG